MSTPTVLVVEDEPSFVEALSIGLRREGFTVAVATDGFQILEKVRATQKIAKMPVIMMTGKSEVTDVARGLALGADGYVTKPFKISGLVSAVNTVLGLD